MLRSGRARDPFLGAYARNIWYVNVLSDMDIQSHLSPWGRDVIANLHMTKMQLLCFVSDNVALSSLSEKAANRTHAAFRPKRRQAYFRMFRIFLAFCICMDVSVARVDVKVILLFLECLICNECSVAMISNYVFCHFTSWIIQRLNTFKNLLKSIDL